MKSDRLLAKAQKLYSKKKYSQVIRILEKEIFTYRENYLFYILLGYSCIRLNDLGAAESYLKRSQNLDHEALNPYLGIGYLYLRKRNTEKALQIYLSVLDDYPGNKYARRALRLLKNSEDPNTLPDVLSKGYGDKLLPPLVSPLPKLILSTLTGVLILGLGATVYLSAPLWNQWLNKPSREGIEFDFQGENYFSLQGEYQQVLTEQEIKNSLKILEKRFQKGQDNAAQKEINYLKSGNVSTVIRQRIQLIESHLKTPTFATLDTNYSYREIRETPFLYDRCFVIWEGRISNLKIEDKITFDFLVGYTEGKVLEAIVPVEVDFGVSLSNDDPVEILAQVNIRNDRVVLKGLSIHKLGL